MKKLFIFITGQYRKFWHSWNNLVQMVIRPATSSLLEVHVCVGIDWTENWKERDIFQTHLQNEWELLQYPLEHLTIKWINKTDPYFSVSIQSLANYRKKNQLDEYWFQYLVFRSGSCLEYVQIARLYKEICSHYEITEDDLLLRTRTDILLRHAMHLENIKPLEQTSTREIFQQLFPSSSHFDDYQEQQGRETSIFPSCFQKNQWVITLRKNLVYLMPMKAGSLLFKIVQQYGDWDNVEANTYWFNAESQFRGCFRMHDFTVWEYSQQKDECYSDFESLKEDFPIYAIYR